MKLLKQEMIKSKIEVYVPYVIPFICSISLFSFYKF